MFNSYVRNYQRAILHRVALDLQVPSLNISIQARLLRRQGIFLDVFGKKMCENTTTQNFEESLQILNVWCCFKVT